MRRGYQAIILLSLVAVVALGGCSRASQTNPASTPEPMPSSR